MSYNNQQDDYAGYYYGGNDANAYYGANDANAYGEAGDATTDMNYAYTDQNSEGYGNNKIGFDGNYNGYYYDETTNNDNVATSYAANDATNDYYDPNQYQNYYYQDEDGNYYMYSDPQQELALETGENAGVTPTPANLVRSYEYEDWEPKSYCWLVDIIVDTFLSKPFKVYLTILLYCGGALIATLGLDYTFAIIFRLFSPPDPKGSKDLQAFAYFSSFFYISFIFVGAFCALMDMLRNLWWQKRSDLAFWGFSHQTFSKKKPPFMIYLIIVLITVPLPILWGLIEAAVQKQSFIYMAQRYAMIAVIVGTFIIAICYVWFFFRAFVMKRRAIRDRKIKDDFRLREKAYKHREEKLTKTHWYHAQIALEEFGMDGQTLRYNCIVFTVGCVPLFAIYAATTINTRTTDPSIAWAAISSVAVICLYCVAWLSLLHRKNQWAMYIAFILIAIQLILGVVGAAVGQYPASCAIVIVTFVACQGMITRKRKHTLSRKELCVKLQIPVNKQIERERTKRRVDSYLFCCRSLILDYLKCMDIKERFGFRHPDIVKAEREYAIKNIALRVDQKALLVWWLIVMFAAAFVVAFGNAVSYKFITPMATKSTDGTPTVGNQTSNGLCTMRFNENGSASLTMLDLSFLAALSYTFGDNGDTDFSTWFSSKPTLVRQYPSRLPPTLNFATDGTNITFSDYVDVSTNFHFITLNANTRGLSIFRDADDWGESIALQVAGAISPLMSFWPENERRSFVTKGAYIKEWFPPSQALHNVTEYIKNLVSDGLGNQTVIIGDQFNGGYAKLLAGNFSDDNVSFVAFNPPGTKYKDGGIKRGVQMSSVRSAWSYIDSLEDAEKTFYYPCDNATMSSTLCGRITNTIQYLLEICGDEQGRNIVDS